MKRLTALFMSLVLLVTLCSCGSPAPGTPPTPTSKAENEKPLLTGEESSFGVQGGAPVRILTAPEEVPVHPDVMKWYKDHINEYYQSGTDETVEELLGYLNSPSTNLFLIWPFAWQANGDIRKSGMIFSLGADATENTFIFCSFREGEAPWLKVYDQDDGGVGLLTLPDVLVEETPNYWKIFEKAAMDDESIQMTPVGEPYMMFVGCCQGGIIELAGTVDGEKARGCYLVLATEYGIFDFMLVAREPYAEYAYSDFYAIFSQAGHYTDDDNEIMKRVEDFGSTQPDRMPEE